MFENDNDEVTLGDFFHVFKKKWIVLLIVFLITAIAINIIMPYFHKSQYQASVSLYCMANFLDRTVDENGNEQVSLNTVNISIANTLVADAVDQRLIFSYDNVLKPVAEKLTSEGYEITADELYNMLDIDYDSTKSTRVFSIYATAESKNIACKIINEIANQGVAFINGYYNEYEMLNIVDMAQEVNATEVNSVSVIKNCAYALILPILLYVIFLIVYLANERKEREARRSTWWYRLFHWFR